MPPLFAYQPRPGNTTFDLTKQYEDNASRAQWTLDRYFLEADWIVVADVLSIGSTYWNSSVGWWYVGPEAPGQPRPELGRDVRLILVANVKDFPQGSLDLPGEGEEFTVYMPGGDAEVQITDEVWLAMNTDAEGGTEGESSGPIPPNPGAITLSYRPKAVLTEGLRVLVLLEEETLVYRDGTSVPKIVPMVSAENTQFVVDPVTESFVNPLTTVSHSAVDIVSALRAAQSQGGPAEYFIENFATLAGA